MTPTVLTVVGTRPNFVKAAPLLRAFEAAGFDNVLVHTGQHYDRELSDTFFDQLGLPEPDHELGVGSGSHVRQTAAVLEALEPVLTAREPDLVIVVGDVNSTFAAALAADQCGLVVAHVEAGLRSGDWTMPEERNRVLTDRLARLLFTPSLDADENLWREGIPDDRIHRVGNVMIDTLKAALPEARRLEIGGRFGLDGAPYALATLHRPSNVDDPARLFELVRGLDAVAADLPVVLPLHPRTRESLRRFGLQFERVTTTDPLGYREMLALMDGATVVVTDSGGIQEETTVLGIPCLTVRPTTERPVTVTHGTNRLLTDRSAEGLRRAVRSVLDGPPDARRPELWDGRAATRIADVIGDWYEGR